MNGNCLLFEDLGVHMRGQSILIQGSVPEDVATSFQERIRELGLTQKHVVSVLATLFCKLPRDRQAKITLALAGGEEFEEFMRAVDRVVDELIASHLPLTAGRVLSRVDAAQAKQKARGRKTRPRRKSAS